MQIHYPTSLHSEAHCPQARQGLFQQLVPICLCVLFHPMGYEEEQKVTQSVVSYSQQGIMLRGKARLFALQPACGLSPSSEGVMWIVNFGGRVSPMLGLYRHSEGFRRKEDKQNNEMHLFVYFSMRIGICYSPGRRRLKLLSSFNLYYGWAKIILRWCILVVYY